MDDVHKDPNIQHSSDDLCGTYAWLDENLPGWKAIQTAPDKWRVDAPDSNGVVCAYGLGTTRGSAVVNAYNFAWKCFNVD